MCVTVSCPCTLCALRCDQGDLRRVSDSPGFEPPSRCWERNPGPMQKQQVYLTAGPSLPALFFVFKETGSQCSTAQSGCKFLGSSNPTSASQAPRTAGVPSPAFKLLTCLSLPENPMSQDPEVRKIWDPGQVPHPVVLQSPIL